LTFSKFKQKSYVETKNYLLIQFTNDVEKIGASCYKGQVATVSFSSCRETYFYKRYNSCDILLFHLVL